MTQHTIFTKPHNSADYSALQWYVDHGIDECLTDKPHNLFAAKPPIVTPSQIEKPSPAITPQKHSLTDNVPAHNNGLPNYSTLIAQAQQIAQDCPNLDKLKQAIHDFDHPLKKTAGQMVFGDGNPKSDIMVIGEAPNTSDDQSGKAFSGQEGALLDKMMAAINISRGNNIPAQEGFYAAHILNWRPPGNRTPLQHELDIALPFIQQHITLIQPKFIIICGAIAAKTLLPDNQASLSKMRQKFYNFSLNNNKSCQAMVTYHPSYLLNTPAQKRAAWKDLLMLKQALMP